MKPIEFPLVISPNLGCPEIVSVKELMKRETIPLIIAGRYGEFISPLKEIFEGAFYLRPSDGGSPDISLYIMDDPKEITNWNLLSEFSGLAATREIINSELHYNVFGEETRYWKINASIKDNYDALLTKKDKRYLPKLFDLVLADRSKKWEKVNYHSIQFVQDFRKQFNFIHLTDLHTAKRNDEILDEVLKVRSKRGRKEIQKRYINFNERFRRFIHIANEMADKGELDFVIITGDLVDFAFHGWEDQPNPAENNWKTFINIVTGSGKEKAKDNPGIKVAIFTSTGNHDWRLHPYNPSLMEKNETFGLEKEELENYNYKSFDSTEYPEDKRARLSREITSNAFKKLNIDAFTDKWKVSLAKFLSSKAKTWVLGTMAGLGLGGASVSYYRMDELTYSGIIVLLGLLVWLIKRIFIESKIRKLVDLIIDNPLHAEAKALHYYFKHINPYLDYAFQYGGHSFIVMDTGADVFIGQLLDGKEMKHIKKMSIEDNILGGSPDSRAFDSEQNYYNWSQIVWLEKVLASTSEKQDGQANTFVLLHGPPINPEDRDDFNKSELWERDREKKGKPKWISKGECNLTYGTINHYLSQFFYLCMGYRESELVREEVAPSLKKKVDLVFSGHAHRNIEFRLEKEWVKNDKKHEIRIHCDEYSQLLDAHNREKWWEEHRPVIVQTASCGLEGKNDKEPPYLRKVTIDAKGQISDFRVMKNGQVVRP